MSLQRPLQQLSKLGAAAHASVPGAYAWAVTVAPVAWGRGLVPLGAKLAAGFALFVPLAGALAEPLIGSRAKPVSLWGFVCGCAAVWLLVPGGLIAAYHDVPRAVAGTLGWALFAFAAAAPPLRQAPAGVEGEGDPWDAARASSLRPRKRLVRGDTVYVSGGAILAASMQLLGWNVPNPERALLVRFVALAAGLAVIGASADIAFARHRSRSHRLATLRLRSARAPLALLGVLGVVGVLLAVRG